MSLDHSLPALDDFTIEYLCGSQLTPADETQRHHAFLNTLLIWLDAESPENTIKALNDKGHAFSAIPDAADGWKIYREPGANSERDFQISVEIATGDVMISTPMSDTAWKKLLATRKQGLTPKQQKLEALREQFYQRGGALFVERYDDADTLDNTERLIIVLYVLESEVNNGGFSQYFVNTGGYEAEQTIDFLGKIGAYNTQNLLVRAVDLVGGPFNIELTDQQYDALDTHESALNQLDNAFYDLDEDIAVLAMQWINGNR